MSAGDEPGRTSQLRRKCYITAMSVSLVIFDLDGTLIDSAADIADALNAMLGVHGCAPLPLAEVRTMIGDGMRKLVERALLARALGAVDPAQAERTVLAHYRAQPVRLTTAYPGTRTALERLRAAGMRLAICTNKPAQLAEAILARLALSEFFLHVVGGDSLPYRKPDPRTLQAVLARFAATPRDALMVGDSEVDAATAAAAGVPLILMDHGYRRGPLAQMTYRAALAHFDQLPELVQAL